MIAFDRTSHGVQLSTYCFSTDAADSGGEDDLVDYQIIWRQQVNRHTQLVGIGHFSHGVL